MPHALTEDHSIEDSQIRRAATGTPWPAPRAEPRARLGTEPAPGARVPDEDSVAPK
jgi:hypothetical protein